MDNLLLNSDYIEMRHSCEYVQVRHKGGGGVILQIAADDFMAACKNWLDHEGYDIVKRQPEIAPCPLCKSTVVECEEDIPNDSHPYGYLWCTNPACVYRTKSEPLGSMLDKYQKMIAKHNRLQSTLAGRANAIQ